MQQDWHLFTGLFMRLYGIFVKKDTYLSYNRKDFHNNFKMCKDILVVGIPASLEHLIIASLVVIVNYMLTLISGSTAVAVYTAGWRIISLGLLPGIGIGIATIPVVGVAYGAKKYENIRTACRYSVKLGLISSIIVCILIFVFANQVAYMFSYSEVSFNLEPLIASFIQLMCLFIVCSIRCKCRKCIPRSWKRNDFLYFDYIQRICACIDMCIPIRICIQYGINWNLLWYAFRRFLRFCNRLWIY